MNKIKSMITPKTKVGELLDAFPELEAVLLELSPSFAKLKNPILKKTVARVATLQQAAIVGGLDVDQLVNRLRKEVGQDELSGSGADNDYLTSDPPSWYDQSRIVQQFDATDIINAGGSPMAQILVYAGKLQAGEIFELKTPFVPAPIIDMLKSRGFSAFSLKRKEVVLSYFEKIRQIIPFTGMIIPLPFFAGH